MPDPVYADLAAFNAAILPQFTTENLEGFFATALASYIPERRLLLNAYRQGTNVNIDDYDPSINHDKNLLNRYNMALDLLLA